MDIFEAIQGRKSIRRFKQTPVPDGDIAKVLDAGRLAPSASNTQPWSFIVVKDHAVLKQMAEAVRAMVERMLPFAENESQAQRLSAYKNSYYTFFENAPALIVVLTGPYDASTDKLLNKMGYADEEVRRLRPLPGLQSVAAAVENMLLAVHALGYGSCWMTGPLVAQEAFQELLGYGKEQTAVALLPMGVPDENPQARSRKPLKDMMKIIE
jgi:nitroreductase